MSLDFSIRVDDPNIEELIAIVRSAIEIQDAADFKDGISLRANGISICVHQDTSLGRNVVKRHFGFFSESRVECTVSKSDTYDAGIHSLLSLATVLISRTDLKNLVLLQNGELPLILMNDSKIYASDHDCYWVKKWQESFIGIEYELKSMPPI